MTENTTKKSFITDLWERRVPQYIATYLGVVWAVLQFLDFLSTRYDLPPYIVDRFLTFCAILLPSVIIFIYNHGRPGRDGWKSYEKFLLPVNFIIACIVAGMVDGTNVNNSITPKEIEVVTDEGNTVTRLVPDINQTKTFSLFPFKNTGPQKDSWLKYSIPYLLSTDMEQDMRNFCIEPMSKYFYNQKEELLSHNHKLEDNNIPFRTYLKIAKNDNSDFLITGDYTYDSEILNINLKIHNSKTGDLFFEENYTSNNTIDIIDEISEDISEKTYLKDSTEDKISFIDLPVSNIVTGNQEALKDYMEANLLVLDQKFGESLAPLSRALTKDPTSIQLLTSQAGSIYMTGDQKKSISQLESIIGQLDDLPERQKFRIKLFYYNLKEGEQDKAYKIVEYWKKLYPRDFEPYSILIGLHRRSRNLKQAKAIAKDALKNGHGARVLRTLANLCITRTEFDEAEKYIDEYYKLFPNKNKTEESLLPKIYLAQGKLKEAIESYEVMNINDPSDYSILLNLANIYRSKGDFEKAENQYLESLKKAKIANDSLSVYRSFISLYSQSGESEKFINLANKYTDQLSKITSPLSLAFTKLSFAGAYADMGFEEIFRQEVQESIDKFPQQKFILECCSELFLSLSTSNKETFKKFNVGDCRTFMKQRIPNFELVLDGFNHKLDGEEKLSIEKFEEYLEKTGQPSDEYGSWIAESYRSIGNNDKAISYCNSLLAKKPGDTSVLYELVLALLEKGDKNEAKISFDKLKELWKNADPRFKYYDDMKALEAQIESI